MVFSDVKPEKQIPTRLQIRTALRTNVRCPKCHASYRWFRESAHDAKCRGYDQTGGRDKKDKERMKRRIHRKELSGKPVMDQPG